MADRDFFRLDQEQWYTEFVDHEISEIRSDTYTHREFFEFDDVPFWLYNNIFNSAETN